MRRPILAGNWKMNKTRDEAIHFVLEVDNKLPNKNVDYIICAPSILLRDLVKRADVIQIGARNMNEHESGAYTGEISPIMLKDTNVKYVIIGHSERRAYYNETDETVNAKIKMALEFDIKPIICVGENLSEREANLTNNILKNQITNDFKDVKINNPEDIIVAYEPIWAIGTGKNATSEQAQEACKYIREELRSLYGNIADEIRILYGGSMNTTNVKELIDKPDVDGGLVGGASLSGESFLEMSKAF